MDNRIILVFIACIAILAVNFNKIEHDKESILKLIGNSLLGALIIFLINLVGTSFNFHIGLSIINSIIVGILGIPGACLLVLLKIFGIM